MQKILTFKINDTQYTIYQVEQIPDEDTTAVGITLYQERKIYIKQLSFDFMKRTLKHELMHIWLWEYGHNQDDENKTFNHEDICEIVACSNDFINDIVEKWEKIVYKNKLLDIIEDNEERS